jgi:hypothetical protein
MKNLILITVIASFFGACNSEPGKENNQTTTPPAEDTSTEAATGTTLPGYPQEKVKLLFDSCDYIDVIFYYEDFSLNQKNQTDIRKMLNYISSNAPQTLNATCQPIGRIFFQVKGRNEAEADIFFQNECLYYLFYENGKYAYANNFTQGGVNFFSKIFAQVNSTKNAAQQQGQ